MHYDPEVELIYSKPEKWLFLLLTLIISLLISGCGSSDSPVKKTTDPVAVNKKPFANAGTDQNVSLGISVVLNGSKSVDPNGDDYTLVWEIKSLPSDSTALLDDPTSISPSFVADAFGDYIIELKVHDGILESEPDEVKTTVLPLSGSRVPDTGQITCADNDGETIECPAAGSSFSGQDACYQFINSPSYTKLDASGNELPETAVSWVMVKDNVTGLIWEVKTDDGTVHDKDNVYPWKATIENANNVDVFISEMNQENFGGNSDWRLPTVTELTNIADYEHSRISVDIKYFPKTKPLAYWTSTPYVYSNGSSDVWNVDFSKGNGFHNIELSSFCARAVRGPLSTEDFEDNNDDTITDKTTGLMWTKDTADINGDDLVTDADTVNWNGALQYCEDLDFAGYSDWRLPNIKELRSIVDYSSSSSNNPAVNLSFFPDIEKKAYWSSTGLAENQNSSWNITFHNGDDRDSRKTFPSYVLAVRDVK